MQRAIPLAIALGLEIAAKIKGYLSSTVADVKCIIVGYPSRRIFGAKFNDCDEVEHATLF